MFSMAGIPPLSGFFGKLYIFLAAVQGGLWTLAVIGVLTSVVGAFYYIRIIKVMYFDAPAEAFDPRPASLSFVVAASGLFTTFFFLFPARSWPRPRRRRRRCSDDGAVHSPACGPTCHGRRRPVTHDSRRACSKVVGWPACAGHDTTGAAGRSPMLLVVDAGNTNVVFAVHDGKPVARHLARPAPRRSAPPTNTPSGCCAVHPCRPEARTTSPPPSSAPSCRPRCITCAGCCRDWFSVEPLVARVHARLGVRDQGRPPGRGRRRPPAERARRPSAASAGR